MKPDDLKKRIIILCAFVGLLVILTAVQLLRVQIVDGDDYQQQAERKTTSSVKIEAARGEILDRYGRPIVKNRVCFNIVFDRIFMERGKENDTIFRLIEFMDSIGQEWVDELPITKTAPYEFLADKEKEVERLKKDLGLQPYATAQNCIDGLVELYDVQGYDETTARNIMSVRYNMTKSGFSNSERYTFARDVSTEGVIKIKELSFKFPGIDVVEDTVREYTSPTSLAHVVGYTGAIFAEEYAELKEKGYALNDVVGREGIEKVMESSLRGTDGIRQVEQNSLGEIISSKITSPTTPGNSVVLSIDMYMQTQLEKAVESHMNWLRRGGNPKVNPADLKGASLVVLDARNGEVLAMVNYPSYDITTKSENYQTLVEDPLNPLFNRASMGLYRPGSTYKTAVALAGLAEGLITPTTTINCNRVYTYYGEKDAPTCLGNHGDINVEEALKVSCNIFFYDLGRRLGIDTINKYASALGLGQKTGIELSEATGVLANPENRQNQGGEWYKGDVLQAAIGQSDNMVTPLQMAVEAMSLANKGEKYQPRLVKSVVDYTGEATIERMPPIKTGELSLPDSAYNTVKEGMVKAASRVAGAYALTNYDFRVAIKTGTPQISRTKFNSAAIGFAPADNPEIAFAIMIEGGENANYLVKPIIDAYYAGIGNKDVVIEDFDTIGQNLAENQEETGESLENQQ